VRSRGGSQHRLAGECVIGFDTPFALSGRQGCWFLYLPLQVCIPYRGLRVRRWGLGLSIVQGPCCVRRAAPNLSVTIRNFLIRGMGSAGLLGSLFVVPAGALPVPVSDSYKGLHRASHRQIFSALSRIYCRPKRFYCRPRPAAQLLPISPVENPIE
jgi:hypothetical protein